MALADPVVLDGNAPAVHDDPCDRWHKSAVQPRHTIRSKCLLADVHQLGM